MLVTAPAVPTMAVTARQFIRHMRGGTQGHLVEADDGQFYVVKFLNNPQGRRVLINEWFGSVVLRHVGLTCAAPVLIYVDRSLLDSNPDIGIRIGASRIPPASGWHFGSRFPGHPDRVAVYDFLPDSLLGVVENRDEFVGALVVDKWAGNADARQAVFLRARVREYAASLPAHPLHIGFVAMMIDHGYMFNGPHWDFPDIAPAGLYFRHLVYRHVRNLDNFQPWLDRVVHFPADLLNQTLRQLPPSWVQDDSEHLARLLDRMIARRKRVPQLLTECATGAVNWFPEWMVR